MPEEFYLEWKNHMSSMMDVFKSLLSAEAMVDVTIACDGQSLKAHKLILSACSPFFQSLFLENPCKHPIVILKDMKYTEVKAIIEFMYNGKGNYTQDQLSALMKVSKTLQVKGFVEIINEKLSASIPDESSRRPSPKPSTSSDQRKDRKRKMSESDHSIDDSSEPNIRQSESCEIEGLCNSIDTCSSSYSNVSSAVPQQIVSPQSENFFPEQSQQQIEQPADKSSVKSVLPEEKCGKPPLILLLRHSPVTDDLPRQSGSSDVQSDVSSIDNPNEPDSVPPEPAFTLPAITSVYSIQKPKNVSGHKGHSCPWCKKTFKYMAAVRIHQVKHTGERRFKCNVCGKLYKHSAVLRRHKRTHITSLPYKCDTCGKCFTRLDSLKCHEPIHTGKWTHMCQHCDYKTSHKGHMKTHMKTHCLKKS